jgi:hypothetical protein
MTLYDAIDDVQRVGSIRAENGKLKLRFPNTERFRLELAIDTLRRNRDAALLALTTTESTTVPPVEAWPESLLDLARERAAHTGDVEAARKEVWISYMEWKARQLNQIFNEHGNHGTGRKPASISWATVQHGMERAARPAEENNGWQRGEGTSA